MYPAFHSGSVFEERHHSCHAQAKYARSIYLFKNTVISILMSKIMYKVMQTVSSWSAGVQMGTHWRGCLST